jgi:hypothetical protein
VTLGAGDAVGSDDGAEVGVVVGITEAVGETDGKGVAVVVVVCAHTRSAMNARSPRPQPRRRRGFML